MRSRCGKVRSEQVDKENQRSQPQPLIPDPIFLSNACDKASQGEGHCTRTHRHRREDDRSQA
jgi:hypothetical protein